MAMVRSKYQLGIKMLHADKRTFEITDLYYGNKIRYSVELDNGHTIHEESLNAPLTAIGFHTVANGNRDQNKIIRTVSKMDEWIKNGYITII